MQNTYHPIETAKEVLTNLFMSRKQNICEVCGNEYDKCFEVWLKGNVHVFDCLECAIHAIAPKCAHCGCTVIGHGLEAGSGIIYCCSHCAKEHGIHDFEDQIVERSSV